MTVKTTKTIASITVIGVFFLSALPLHVAGQEAKTVVGPHNADLSEGSDALMAGNAERGVELILKGLKYETRQYDRRIGLSNLCAGYIMLGDLETALSYCNQAIDESDRHWRAYSNRALIYVKLGQLEKAEADLEHAESMAPKARPVRAVRSMLRDRLDPVAPTIIIDDRRNPGDETG